MPLKHRVIPFLGLIAPLVLLSALRRCTPDTQFELLGMSLYWIAALLSLACVGLFLTTPKNFPESPRAAALYLLGALCAIGLAYFSNQIFEPGMRVQWDEAELYDTSLSMRFRQTALTPAMALPGPNPGEVMPIFFRLGRRPPLYPFAVSLSHIAFGASEANPPRVNTVLLATLLYSTFCLVFTSLGAAGAFSSLLLLSSAPLLFWQGTSGSMDLLASCAVLALAWAAASHWRQPSTRTFASFLLMGLIASYTRYEVIGIFAILLPFSAWRAAKADLPIRTLLNYLAPVPTLLLPLLLVVINASGSFVEAGDQSVFHPSYFFTNGITFLKNFFLPSSSVYQGTLNLLAAAAILLTLYQRKKNAFAGFLAIATSFSLALTLAFFNGNPIAFESARLFLLSSLAMALAPLLLLYCFPGKKLAGALLAIALLTFAMQAKSAWKAKILPESLATLAGASLHDFMLTDPRAKEPKALYIFHPSEFLLSLGKAAVDLDFFLEHEQELGELKAQGAIGKIFWIHTGTEVPAQEIELMRKQLELRYTMREAVRLPLNPISTVIYELVSAD